MSSFLLFSYSADLFVGVYQLNALLPTSSFIAIDEEMTGIHLVSPPHNTQQHTLHRSGTDALNPRPFERISINYHTHCIFFFSRCVLSSVSVSLLYRQPGTFVEKMDDSTSDRYDKMKLVAEQYKIIQIGVCLYHENVSSDSSAPLSYTARPYNFYLFPEDGMIRMEASAIAFNKDHGMDFNKWIYEGSEKHHANETHLTRSA